MIRGIKSVHYPPIDVSVECDLKTLNKKVDTSPQNCFPL